jgi:flagellar hook-length control protein FliK
MEIPSGHLPTQRLTASIAGLIQRFHPGQVLEARVLQGPTGTQPSPNIRVQIGADILDLHAQLPVDRGQVLKLRVMSIEPKLELELIGQQKTQAQKPDSVQTGTERINESLRQFIPRQQGLQYVTAQFQQGLEQNTLPPAIRETLRTLLAAVPDQAALQKPEKIAEAVRNSGVFLEASLAAGKSIPESDLKLLLLSLMDRVRSELPRGTQPSAAAPLQPEGHKETPLPFLLTPVAQPRISPQALSVSKPDGMDQLILRLFGMTESALSRISLHQIATADAQQQGDARWKMEIPLAFPNAEFGVMQLFIERERPDTRTSKPHPEEEQSWSLAMAVDLPELGPLHVRLRLSGQRLETRILAENAASAQRLNKHLPRLRVQLEDQGLDISHLDCQEGKPDPTRSSTPLNMLNLKV